MGRNELKIKSHLHVMRQDPRLTRQVPLAPYAREQTRLLPSFAAHSSSLHNRHWPLTFAGTRDGIAYSSTPLCYTPSLPTRNRSGKSAILGNNLLCWYRRLGKGCLHQNRLAYQSDVQAPRENHLCGTSSFRNRKATEAATKAVLKRQLGD
jgi:hypothetical protein